MKLMQLGAITPNQICDKENFPRFDGGDKHYINQTYAPLDDAGVPIKAAPPANAPAFAAWRPTRAGPHPARSAEA